MKSQQQVPPTKQFNPYDLNEIAEVEKTITLHPLLLRPEHPKPQQHKAKRPDKHKIQKGILNPNSNT